ncbi:MAG: NlpC/P60 family protein [Actinomycetota bacterium]
MVEEYNLARIRLDELERKVSSTTRSLEQAAAALSSVKTRLSSRAATAYRGGVSDGISVLLTSRDPREMTDRLATLNLLADRDAALLADLQGTRATGANAITTAAKARDAQGRLLKEIAARKVDIESALQRQRQLVALLNRSDRVVRAARSVRYPPVKAPNARAGVAVNEAFNQLGKPYRYGAAGPGSFDCSGLTMWVWGKAGVRLPHSASSQYNSAPRVPRDQLAPGDLVFFGSPPHHTGIYVGNGNMIHAPSTGDVVKVAPYGRRDYVGAVRPGT